MVLHRLLITVFAVSTLLAPAHARAEAPTLDDCRAQIRENPANPVVYYCVYRSVLAHGGHDEAAALLRRSFEQNPGVFRIEMIIAWIDRMRGRSDSDDLLRDAIDGMESTGDFHGVVYGGLELAYRLGERGEFAEAEVFLDRCARSAGRTGDPMMEARVWIGQASLAMWHADYSQWLHLTRRAERTAFPAVRTTSGARFSIISARLTGTSVGTERLSVHSKGLRRSAGRHMTSGDRRGQSTTWHCAVGTSCVRV